MKITIKGQVTIPLSIRDEFGFKPGTEVEFIADNGRVVLRQRRKRGNVVGDRLQEATGVGRRGATTARIMKLTRGEG